ncbi:VOC family protein [Luteimonas marina]|uniref:VOC family protein n=1 Tax=Luteimonas marina TaxID=488485 RepID=A0A5C5TT29_9GAMM|nr:VOC family protein [Luteimonas marina]
MSLSTYLLLDGSCKEAMQFYHSCLGGQLSVSLVGDTPIKAMFPPEMHNRVINAHLKAEGISLSASDWMLPSEQPTSGNTVCLYISGGSAEETRSLFDKLSGSARVTDPLTEQPFGLYGALNDKFGIRWMFHSDNGK